MASNHEEKVRTRAYEIWEREGRPTGRAQQHWEQARREIENESRQGQAPSPRASARWSPSPDEGETYWGDQVVNDVT